MEQGFFYLASPYQGTEEEQAYRLRMSLKVATAFLRQGICVFAPLVYDHENSKELNVSSLEQRREIFMPFLFNFLATSKGMIVLCLEGWEKSWGVRQELIYCRKNGISVYEMDPNQMSSDLSEIFKQPIDTEILDTLLDVA